MPDPGRSRTCARLTGPPTASVDPRIMAALMRLPARQRQVVALRLFLDLDTDRTAEVLGIAPGTVRLTWAAPSPRCATTLCPNDSRRAHHERRRTDHRGAGAAQQSPLCTPGGADHQPRPRGARPSPDSRRWPQPWPWRPVQRCRDRAAAGQPPASHSPASSWRPGRSSSSPTATSMSPSASCVTRPGCKAGSARTASRPASPSSASSTRLSAYPAA